MAGVSVAAALPRSIADCLVRFGGEVYEAIVFEDEATPGRPEPAACEPEDIFAEMAPFMVDVQNVDDSREAIYTRMEGERYCSTPPVSRGLGGVA